MPTADCQVQFLRNLAVFTFVPFGTKLPSHEESPCGEFRNPAKLQADSQNLKPVTQDIVDIRVISRVTPELAKSVQPLESGQIIEFEETRLCDG